MTDDSVLAPDRDRLRVRVEALVGPGPIPRFDEALTHPSFANEVNVANNQRLEFLGDAVLGLCVRPRCSLPRTRLQTKASWTRMRSAALVNRKTASAAWARRVDLGGCISLGRGAQLGTEREQTSVLADATEALIAAIYDARGLGGARALVQDIVGELLEDADALETRDPKSALQELVQSRGMPAPTYRVIDVRGAPHEQTFDVEVVFADAKTARGEGRSKRLAERAAAAAALAELGPPGAGMMSDA